MMEVRCYIITTYTGVWKHFELVSASCSVVGVMVSGIGSGDAGGATGQGSNPTRSYFLFS